MRNRTLTYSAVGALALGMAGMSAAQAEGINWEAGDWTIGIDGNVNSFYTIRDADETDDVVLGGLTGGNGAENHNIQTGLLPSKLGVSAATTQNGWDVEAYVSYWPGTSSVTGLNTNEDNVNFRQVYFSFGNENVGTFKIGRDLGLFQSESILSDMTLMGVGVVGPLGDGGNTTLGRIGTGYQYADWRSQISYQTPMMNGLQATVAVMEPWQPFSAAPGDNSYTDGIEAEQPGIEGKLTYDFQPGGFDTRLWTSFTTQEVDNGAQVDYTARGFELGGKATFGDFEAVASYYDGKGIGTTALFHQAVNQQGDERDSDGFFVQGVYTLPATGTRLGLSYGESTLDQEGDDPDTLVDKNSAVTVGAYHPLTPSVTLTAEYTDAESENHNGDKIEEDVIALGGIMFF